MLYINNRLNLTFSAAYIDNCYLKKKSISAENLNNNCPSNHTKCNKSTVYSNILYIFMRMINVEIKIN